MNCSRKVADQSQLSARCLGVPYFPLSGTSSVKVLPAAQNGMRSRHMLALLTCEWQIAQMRPTDEFNRNILCVGPSATV